MERVPFRPGDSLSAATLNEIRRNTVPVLTAVWPLVVEQVSHGQYVIRLAKRMAASGRGGGADPTTVIYASSSYAGLVANDNIPNVAFGYTFDKGNFYAKDHNAQWRILHPFRQDDPPSGIGERNGDLWYDSGNGRVWCMRDNAWRITHPFEQNTVPNGIGEQTGDLWYAPTSKKLSYYNGASWTLLSHFT